MRQGSVMDTGQQLGPVPPDGDDKCTYEVCVWGEASGCELLEDQAVL